LAAGRARRMHVGAAWPQRLGLLVAVSACSLFRALSLDRVEPQSQDAASLGPVRGHPSLPAGGSEAFLPMSREDEDRQQNRHPSANVASRYAAAPAVDAIGPSHQTAEVYVCTVFDALRRL
jgi:hypothetical protein